MFWHGVCTLQRMDFQRDDLKQRHRRRRWILGGGLVTLALIAGTAISRLGPPVPVVNRNSVWIDTVKRGEMVREVRAEGVLSPKEIRWVTAQTAASVERVLVKPGLAVKADTVLMELSNPELSEQLDSARAAVAAARADGAAKRMAEEGQLLDQRSAITQIRTAYELARRKVEATQALAKEGIIAALTFQEYSLTADQQKELLGIAEERLAKLRQTLRAQISADQARIDQLQNAYALRRHQVEALHVAAGNAGVLQSVPIQEGQQVAAGTNLARIARPGALRAELRVAETLAGDLKVGLHVSVDTRNGIIAGRVERIDPAVQKGSVQVDVELLGSLPSDVRPDQSVEGAIEIERLADVVYVPRPAVAQPNSQLSLFRVSTDGHSAERISVRLGHASIALVEVTQGLDPGDRVVLSDTSAWDGSSKIRLQ